MECNLHLVVQWDLGNGSMEHEGMGVWNVREWEYGTRGNGILTVHNKLYGVVHVGSMRCGIWKYTVMEVWNMGA